MYMFNDNFVVTGSDASWTDTLCHLYGHLTMANISHRKSCTMKYLLWYLYFTQSVNHHTLFWVAVHSPKEHKGRNLLTFTQQWIQVYQWLCNTCSYCYWTALTLKPTDTVNISDWLDLMNQWLFVCKLCIYIMLFSACWKIVNEVSVCVSFYCVILW